MDKAALRSILQQLRRNHTSALAMRARLKAAKDSYIKERMLAQNAQIVNGLERSIEWTAMTLRRVERGLRSPKA